MVNGRALKTNQRAVVVGLCQHGLAIVRSLARSGVEVVALEQNHALPGFRTRCARVLRRAIDSEGLVKTLTTLDPDATGDRPVLFLTNDTMTRMVARAIDEVRDRYCIPWASSAAAVLALQDKSRLREHCRELDICYPEAVVYRGSDDLEAVAALRSNMLIAKPVKPLSQFKTCRLTGPDELDDLAGRYAESLPFLVQDWIPGPDRSLYFCAVYLVRGRIHASFIGRKVASHPPAQGQTTAAVTAMLPDLEALTERFFANTGYTGPASVEYKVDDQGTPWVIEPTVGRTDFWLDLAIHSGADFPLIQYRHVTGQGPPSGPNADDARLCTWHDSERDPLGTLKRIVSGKVPRFGRHVFSYWSLSDPVPAIRQTAVLARRLLGR